MQEAIGSNPIFSTLPFDSGHTLFDILRQDCKQEMKVRAAAAEWQPPGIPPGFFPERQEVNQGAWWMPWLKEAMKDAGSCENLR